jgi:hypothetical protein
MDVSEKLCISSNLQCATSAAKRWCPWYKGALWPQNHDSTRFITPKDKEHSTARPCSYYSPRIFPCCAHITTVLGTNFVPHVSTMVLNICTIVQILKFGTENATVGHFQCGHVTRIWKFSAFLGFGVASLTPPTNGFHSASVSHQSSRQIRRLHRQYEVELSHFKTVLNLMRSGPIEACENVNMHVQISTYVLN